MKHLLAVLALAIGSLFAFALAPEDSNIAILGDSNTWLGGDACSRPRGWNKWFAEDFGAKSCRSYARSGATWTHTADTRIDPDENIAVLGDNNVISAQVERLHLNVERGRQAAPDIIMIACGTNDAWFPRKRPRALEADSSSVLTLDGAVTADCRRLRSLFPKARIVLLTPLQSIAISADTLDAVTGIIERCAAKEGADVIRQDTLCCVKRDTEYRRRTFTTDGTHTSVTGAKENGRRIARELKRIISE